MHSRRVCFPFHPTSLLVFYVFSRMCALLSGVLTSSRNANPLVVGPREKCEASGARLGGAHLGRSLMRSNVIKCHIVVDLCWPLSGGAPLLTIVPSCLHNITSAGAVDREFVYIYWAQRGPNVAPLGSNSIKLGSNWAPLGSIWIPLAPL